MIEIHKKMNYNFENEHNQFFWKIEKNWVVGEQ